MESSESEKISTFMSLTSANAERARAYLEANQGDLNAAVAMYIAEVEADDEEEASSGVATSGSNAEPQPSQSAPSQSSQAPRQPPQPQSRFVTMDALRGRHGAGGSDSEDDEGAQAFYVGGSEHGGGQQVLGPPGSRKRPDAGNIASSLFASARQHGATEVPPEEAAGRGGGGFAAFGGRGLRLDQEPAASIDSAARPHLQQPLSQTPVCRVLKLWSNGVSIDDGPLRGFEEPETRELLRAVAQGHVPQELRADARGARVDLQLEDHRDVEFSAPAVPAFRAFGGSGLVLGSPVPPATVSAAPPAATAAAASSASSAKGGGSTAVPLDPAKPITQLNVRLPSGGRPLSVSLNHSHTVADLRSYLRAERPDLANASFVFMTTFPTAEITDETATLESAGLINAAVLVRIK